MEKINKTKSVIVRLTEQEHKTILRFADQEETTISDIFRSTVLATAKALVKPMYGDLFTYVDKFDGKEFKRIAKYICDTPDNNIILEAVTGNCGEHLVRPADFLEELSPISREEAEEFGIDY